MNTGNTSESSLVTAKGTGDGLVLRLSAITDSSTLLKAMKDYVSARKSFLCGNDVSLEWIDGLPSDDLVRSISECLEVEFQINVRSEKAREIKIHSMDSSSDGSEAGGSPRGLLAGIEAISEDSNDLEVEASGNTNSMFWDNPDAMIMTATLRSGQKIETEHSLVLIGDVNCGAEIVAGGDVVVLGTVRGVLHAGAYDETGGGRFIFGLNLQPTQLRIGSIISRGAGKSKTPEIAYVDGNAIVVEPYNARTAVSKMG